MVPPSSVRIPRVRIYSGYRRPASHIAYMTLTFFGSLSQVILLCFSVPSAVLTPGVLLLPVWPPPLSLATTRGISFDFFSSGYLDVSVPRVPRVTLWIHVTLHDYSSWGFPHSDIHGSNTYLQFPVAYRSLSRPSSAPDAKAFALCSYSLELSFAFPSGNACCSLNCLSFINKFFSGFISP